VTVKARLGHDDADLALGLCHAASPNRTTE
jgi:hypothetical protein